MIRFLNSKSKSPLPPFFKGGNSTAFSSERSSNGFLALPTAKAFMHEGLPCLSSPFEKGGSRGICLALFLLFLQRLQHAAYLFALGGAAVVWRLLRRGRNAPPPGDDETQEW